MKKVKDVTSTILLLIAVMTSVLTILNAIQLSTKVDMQEKADNKYRYQITYEASFPDRIVEGENEPLTDEEIAQLKDNYKKLFERLSAVSFGNVYMKNCTVRLGNSNNVYVADLLFSGNESLKLDVQEGVAFPDFPDTSENEAIIGENLLFLSQRNEEERWIAIDYMDYKVIGILTNEAAGGNDVRCILDLRKQNHVLREHLINSYSGRLNVKLQLALCSDEEFDFMDNALTAVLDTLPMEYEISTGSDGAYYADLMAVFIRQTVVVIAMVFSAVTCISASLIWLQRRRKELVLRRVFGYSIINIIEVLFSDSMPVLAMGVFGGSLLFGIQVILKGESNFLYWHNLPEILLELMAGIAVIESLILLVPYLKLRKDNLIDGLHGRK